MHERRLPARRRGPALVGFIIITLGIITIISLIISASTGWDRERPKGKTTSVENVISDPEGDSDLDAALVTAMDSPFTIFELDTVFTANDQTLTLEQLAVAEHEIAITFSADLGDDAFPMGDLISVRTGQGDVESGTGVSVPMSSATDTRIRIFPIDSDESPTITVIPGRYTATEQIEAEIEFDIPASARGITEGERSFDLNTAWNIAGYPVEMTTLNLRESPDGIDFEIRIDSMEQDGVLAYPLAPRQEQIRLSDNLGNSYAYTGGGFGDGSAGMNFNGPIPSDARTLTLSIQQAGIERGFDGEATISLRD